MQTKGLLHPAFVDLWLVSLFGYLGFQLLAASLPLYVVALGGDDFAVGLLVGLVAVVALVARPWVGWWLDRGGGVWALMLGAAIFALCSLGYWLAASVFVVLALRALTGLAVASTGTA